MCSFVSAFVTHHVLEIHKYCFLNGASLIAQVVKMQETPVQFLGQEDPLEKG